MKKNRKSRQKNKKIFLKVKPVFLYAIFATLIFTAVIVALLATGFFMVSKSPKQEAPILSVAPETVAQGDTVLIKVETSAKNVSGSFAGEKIFFYKKEQIGKQAEWIAFLGVDADHAPGDYKIFVDAGSQGLVKDIKVLLAEFSSASQAPAPQKQSGVSNQKAVNNIRKADNPVVNKVLENFTEQPYFKSSFGYPLKKVETSGFSFGKFISFGKTALQHFGVDLRAYKDTNVYAVNDGKVVAVFDLSNYGKTVVIDHGLDIFSLYLHLNKFEVKEGDMVSKGQVIGLSGDTGYVTAPHLHFSMRVGGQRVNPISFIKTTQQTDNASALANITQAVENLFK